MAEALYDFSVITDGYLKFGKKYQPDGLFGHAYLHGGMGPIFEILQPNTVRWAGMPGNIIDKNSIHQFIEFPLIKEEDFDLFDNDRTGWLFSKGLPMIAKLLEPVAKWNLSTLGPMYAATTQLAAIFSSPETKKLFEAFDKITTINNKVRRQSAELDEKIEKELGIPALPKGFAAVPFDAYSDFYRGTLDAMADMLERDDVIARFSANALKNTLRSIEMQGKIMPGKWVFMALHKGIDGFMSDAQYRRFYWKDLQTIIEHIIANGMTPYIYTEGSYTSRLDCLKEVTKGKVVYHFEQCDMAQAKKTLGNTACIAGAFPIYLLEFGTKQQVIDEAKRLIDICAPGGGFIFETSSGYDAVKTENVEALFETVRTYGKK
ncbi:conserved hypothetical protein [Treponema primitia ZAS-2]|uniref:Uroporphyrinogen decarboxylase (URO-D) domain-containing protein n=1 Tax=Treponema primitia (strain ATCC BAA-887 / DSM 12427 / ZAS-2) TaxID=545694 RepID=F5YLC6_TREPZ|nr:uroporphyrinogen decarboxylase family protein [Treponema primitia]AEF84109.1 conserved hypothetical protein [Treponema primitia ZAS-2]